MILRKYFNNEVDFHKIIQQSETCRGHCVQVIQSSHGKSSYCYFAQGYGNEIIFKFPRTNFSAETIFYEKTVTDFIKNLVPCSIPNISIEHTNGCSYAVYQAISGTNMSDVTLDEHECRTLSVELVQFISRIHAMPLNTIPFKIHRKKDSIELFCKDFDYTPRFSDIEDLLAENTLIHGDFHRSNILLDNNKKLCGVLDFATFSMGSIYFDLGQMVFSMKKPFNDIFIEEYEKLTGKTVNMKKLQRVITFLDDMINEHYLPFIKGGQYV